MNLLNKIIKVGVILKQLEKEVTNEYEFEGQVRLLRNGKVVHKYTFD